MDKLLPLKLPPGMRNTGTVYQSKDSWYTGNFVRFFQDTIQPIGGWTARTLTSVVTRNQFVITADNGSTDGGTGDVTMDVTPASGADFLTGDTIALVSGASTFTGTGISANRAIFLFAENPDMTTFAAGATNFTLWTWTHLVPVTAAIIGVPRAMITYRINSGAQLLVVGTTNYVYSIDSSGVVSDITPVVSGAVIPAVTNRIWQFDVFGSYLVVCSLDAPATGGSCWYWTGDTATFLVQLGPFSGTDPVRALSIVGTPERFLVTLGSRYSASGYVALGSSANSRKVTWATQEGGFVTADWDITDASITSGEFELTTSGSLMAGLRGRGATLLWTTVDLWGMAYIGGTLLYRFDKLGDGCGLIASHAAVVTDRGAFWMGESSFFHYEGFVSPIPCDVQDYVFGSLNRTYAHYIWALHNPTFNEVTWFYPHAAQTEITRYVTYNYVEQHWVTGSLARTAGVSIQPSKHIYPVMANASGSIFDHETGTGRNSEGTPSLESGPLELEGGDNLLSLQKVIPDDKTVGDVNLTIYTAPNPDTAETSNGPYTLSAKTDVRLKARQIRVKLTQAVASAWRVGTIRLGVTKSSRR